MKSSTARALGRVSGRMLRSNKYIDAAVDAGRFTLKRTGKVAHALWLQVTGFVFCVFAAVGATACRREYQRIGGEWAHDGRFLVALAFTLLFAYFGISSFVKARR